MKKVILITALQIIFKIDINVLSNENAEKKFNISFEYNEEISVILKDAKGDPSKNRLNIVIDLSLFDAKDNLIASKNFQKILNIILMTINLI